MALHERRIPEFLRHAATPGVAGFAALASLEAAARGVLISVYPVEMYRALGDAETVSEIYFLAGIVSLAAALLVPFAERRLSRRWVYTFGALLLAAGAALAGVGGPVLTPIGLAFSNTAVVITFVCFNAYVLDYVRRADLRDVETKRLFYAAFAWTAGPVLGVWLSSLWRPAPFAVAAVGALAMLALFWVMRLSPRPQIARAAKAGPNPIRYIPRFVAQKRLVAGWLFAVVRSVGWWVYVIYLPIYAVESGYGDAVGGIMLSGSNALLFVTPFMLRWMKRRSVRLAVRTGFCGAACSFALAWGLSLGLPWAALAALAVGSAFLILLDISAGLPFLMAVRPHERTEMSVVYSSFRDVSGVITPGIARLILAVAPFATIFVAAAGALFACWALAGRLHPRLGAARRTSRGAALAGT